MNIYRGLAEKQRSSCDSHRNQSIPKRGQHLHTKLVHQPVSAAHQRSKATGRSWGQQVHGAGGQIGLTYVPWDAALNFHAFAEYSAIARLQGIAYGASVALKF